MRASPQIARACSAALGTKAATSHSSLTAAQRGASLFAAARAPATAATAASPIALRLRSFSSSPSPAAARKTVLYDFHVANGGKIVPFAGYSMPLTYASLGQVASHNHTRTAASLFDVSHMVQHYFSGPGAAAFLQWLTPSSLAALPNHQGTLSVLLNFGGGILDDTVITKINDEKFYVVTNAGRRDEDLAWIGDRLKDWQEQGKPAVEHTVLEEQGLVALQGPKAAEVLSKHVDPAQVDLSKLTFGKSAYATVAGVPDCHIARGGYTGEDGFEISIAPAATEAVSRALLETEPVQLAGLAARDSLRLEAGMCLYGHDLNEGITPAEGGLTWVVGKDRRETADFIGAERVLADIKEGPKRRRVGFTIDGPPAREGAPVFEKGGTEAIGAITSGIPSPTLGKNIAMGYVQSGHHKRGTLLEVEVRGKRKEATVAKMPFVESKFYRG